MDSREAGFQAKPVQVYLQDGSGSILRPQPNLPEQGTLMIIR
jgi:hypothetical protein